ncbi:hypothetical protein VTH06DRAFT_5065 [Thermothelomyces fergusii]
MSERSDYPAFLVRSSQWYRIGEPSAELKSGGGMSRPVPPRKAWLTVEDAAVLTPYRRPHQSLQNDVLCRFDTWSSWGDRK